MWLSKGLLFTLVVAVLMPIAGCGRKQSGPVATVNGDPINNDEFVAYLKRKPFVSVMTAQGTTADAKVPGNAPLGFQAMRDLINRRILVQLAKEEGVSPSNADIDQEIAFQTKDDSSFVKRLTDQGMSLQEIKGDIAIDLAQQRLLTKGVTVTDAEVDDYMKQHPSELEYPPMASLLWVVVDSSSLKDQVDRDLTAGQNFRVVAARYSLAPFARQNNGLYPERNLNKIAPPIRALIDKTPELQTTPWYQNGKQWAKFYVEKKVAARKLPIDDVLKTKIRRFLAVQKGRETNDLSKNIQDAIRKAKIQIEEPAYKAMWKDSMTNLTQAPSLPSNQGG